MSNAESKAKKKICFVIQRYGLEVNGGAETYCRELAEKMLPYYDVSVFTTKAVEYTTWCNEYSADEEEINGVHIYRHPVDHPRRNEVFNDLNGRFMRNELHGPQAEAGWFEAQGPYSPALLAALKQHHDDYDAFIMCTYLYYQTAMGTALVADKAILISMAHDEPFLRFNCIKKLFRTPRAIFYLTDEERKLVQERMHTEDIPCAVGGAGVDLPADISAERFIKKNALEDTPYIIYVGRIDEGKNCDVMFRYWQAFKQRNPGPLKLVLMGKAVIPVPERDDILNLGFVSEQDKFDGIAGARFLLLPSRFESLSIVVLEAMSLNVPVLVNGECAVLKAHCTVSNAGLYYENYPEFEATMNLLLNNETVYEKMRQNAPLYVEEHYRWDVITGKLAGLIEAVSKEETDA